MGLCYVFNKGTTLRCYSPKLIYPIPLFAFVQLCMAVTAHRHQVREAESDGRVRNVLRSNVFDMVDRVRWYVLPALEADLTESARLLEV